MRENEDREDRDGLMDECLFSALSISRLLLLLLLLVLMLLQDKDGLLDFGLERLGRVQQVKQLDVVDLEQHACDLARPFRVHAEDELVETLAQHPLLFLWLRRCQHHCRQGLLA